MRWFLLALALVSTTASAAPLRYQWKAGQTHRFATHSTDVIKVGGPAMGLEQTFSTTSTFAIAVAKVDKKGTAHGDVIVEAFEVKDQTGRVIAGLKNLPKNALKNPVEIDALGNFKLKQVTYLVVNEAGGSMLVSGKASPNSVSASSEANGEQVSVWAEFDPKTGRLKGGYSEKKLAPKKKVQVKEEATEIDLLPVAFLEMLRLPEGDVKTGDTHEVAMTGPVQLTLTFVAEDVTAKEARLRVKLASDLDTKNAGKGGTVSAKAGNAKGGKAKAGFAIPAAAEADDEGADGEGMDMDAGDDDMGGGAMPAMMGMPGMGAMPGMPGAGGGGTPGALKVNTDFTARFDVAAGMLSTIEGTMTSSMDAGGMTIDQKTTASMKRL